MLSRIVKLYSMLSEDTKQTINVLMGFIAMAITIGTVFIIAALFTKLFRSIVF